jgi:hypothetical protein
MLKHKHKSHETRLPETMGTLTEELTGARQAAARLWNMARHNDRGFQLSGLAASFDESGEKAFITERQTPAVWTTTALSYGKGGVWNIEATHYRPGSELEPHGSVVGRSVAYTLAENEPVVYAQMSYRQMGSGALEPVGSVDAIIGEPIDAATAHVLGQEMGQIAVQVGMHNVAGHAAHSEVA